MNYHFTPEAQEDLRSAADFYESQRDGLGTEFVTAVGLAVARVLEAPARWPEVESGVRKYRLHRFPYGIFYRAAAADRIEVVAVFDLRRRPGRWRDKRS
jgi:toxin ParE1/3/4